MEFQDMSGPHLDSGRALVEGDRVVGGKVYVIIWFDVEDYFTPKTDDADMWAAELASTMGVPVTIKVVGEKARNLERRGRHDVLRALAQHDLGYHTDWHSRPPTIATYLRDMTWEEGVREFERREAEGFEDVRRIFGKDPVCFGQPGSSWAPQIYPVLKKWGIRLYLDEARHVGLSNGQPFWFQDMLHVFNMRANAVKMELGSQTDFQQTCELFRSAYWRLREQGGGLISVFYHPLELVYHDFQDVVNFGQGRNTPIEEWREGEKRTALEISTSYQHLKQFFSFMRSHNDLLFINASQALELYAVGRRQKAFSESDILRLAYQVQREITFQAVNGIYLSAAEIFYVLTNWLMNCLLGSSGVGVKNLHSPMGPTRFVQTRRPEETVSWCEFRRALSETMSFLEDHNQVPSAVLIDTRHVSPQDFLATLGKIVEHQIKGRTVLVDVNIQAGTFTVFKCAAEDSLALWMWPIFPEGFHAPNLMQLTQLQTWTIKPACLVGDELDHQCLSQQRTVLETYPHGTQINH